MTASEAARVCSMVRMLWPHAQLPAETPRLWAQVLPDAEAADVEAAIRELSVDGREFPPLIGQIAAKLNERANPFPDPDEMQAEFFRLLKRYSHQNPPPPEAYSHALLGFFFGGNNNARWREWCLAEDGDTTFYAQQREAYKAMRVRTERDRNLGIIGAPRPARGQLRAFADTMHQLGAPMPADRDPVTL